MNLEADKAQLLSSVMRSGRQRRRKARDVERILSCIGPMTPS